MSNSTTPIERKIFFDEDLEKGKFHQLRTKIRTITSDQFNTQKVVVFETGLYKSNTGKSIYFLVNKKNLPDSGKLQAGGPKSEWRVRIDSVFENDKTIIVYVALPDAERISHQEFSVAGYTRLQEIEVMVGTGKDGGNNFILPDKRQPGFCVKFHINGDNEDQVKKLNSSKFRDKWLARVMYLTAPDPDDTREQKVVYADIELLESSSRAIVDEFRTGFRYTVAVTAGYDKVRQLCYIVRDGRKIIFCLDKNRPEYKASHDLLQTMKVGWNTQFLITRGDASNKDVVLYGYLTQAVRGLNDAAA